MNNVLMFVAVIIFGGFEEAFVDTETTGTPMMLVTLVAQGVVLALMLWQAKRAGHRSALPADATRPDGVPGAHRRDLESHPRA